MKQKLEKAEEMLRAFETEAAAAFLKELAGSTYRGEPVGRLLEETMKLINNYETAAAAERLRALAGEVDGTQGEQSGE